MLRHAAGIFALRRRAATLLAPGGASQALRLTLRFALGCTARVDDGAPPVHFTHGSRAVLFGYLTGRYAVEVEAARCAHQRLQIGRAGGVAVQEERERLAAEYAGRTQLDVGLDAQLDGQGAARTEQGREARGQFGSAGGGPQVGWRRGGACLGGQGLVRRGLGGRRLSNGLKA
jgi:hypothetical protein